jgi:hypothetical protein
MVRLFDWSVCAANTAEVYRRARANGAGGTAG